MRQSRRTTRREFRKPLLIMAGENKKQVPLRIAPKLYEELNRWAQDDFRSLNGQIEYLLTQCVQNRRRALKQKDEESSQDSR